MRAFLTAKRHHLLMIQVYYLHPPTILKWEGISFLSKPLDLTHIHHSSLPNVIFSFLFMLHTTCIPSESSCTGCRRLSWVSKATSRQENVNLPYFTFQLVILDSSICGRRVRSARCLLKACSLQATSSAHQCVGSSGEQDCRQGSSGLSLSGRANVGSVTVTRLSHSHTCGGTNMLRMNEIPVSLPHPKLVSTRAIHPTHTSLDSLRVLRGVNSQVKHGVSFTRDAEIWCVI